MAYLLPQQLNCTGDVKPDLRHRGIFEVPVYKADLKLKGSFDLAELEKLNIDSTDFYWDEAELNIGISDLRGIENKMNVVLGNQRVNVEAGTQASGIITSGIHCLLLVRLRKKDLKLFGMYLT